MMQCPGTGTTDSRGRIVVFCVEISLWSPSKPPQNYLLLTIQSEGSTGRRWYPWYRKGDRHELPGGVDLPDLLSSDRASLFPLGPQLLGPWIIALHPVLLIAHQRLKYSWIASNELSHFTAVTSSSSLLLVTKQPGNNFAPIRCIFRSSWIILRIDFIPTPICMHIVFLGFDGLH